MGGKSKEEELVENFSSLGIDFSKPGFYNEPNFKAEETKRPAFLTNYVEYVAHKTHSSDYLDKAAEVVPKLLKYVYDALVEDGRLSACADASTAFLKMLEQFGYWSGLQAGSLTLEFDAATKIKPKYWPSMSSKQIVCGHAWLIVPPFSVVDLTISRQITDDTRLATLLPPFVMQQTTERVLGVRYEDLVDDDLSFHYMTQFGRKPTIHQIMEANPEMADCLRRFKPFSIRHDAVTAKYFPCHVSAPIETFDELPGHCFSGRTVKELFQDIVNELGSPAEIGAFDL